MINRYRSALALGLSVLSVLSQVSLAEDPHSIVPGYERFRAESLSSAEAGRVLISELSCQSCHGELNGNHLSGRQAPILTEVGQRTSADYLRRYLRNPHSEKPGTAMPRFSPEKMDDATIDGLVAFLTNGQNWRPAAVGVDAIRRGEKLFHQVGCAACHSDQRSDEEIEKIRRGASPEQVDEEEEDDENAEKKDTTWKRPAYAMPLGKLDQKYSLASLITFLREPHKVRPSGRMPSLNLTPEEARDVASYLLKDVKVEPNIHFEYFEGDWQKLPDFSTLKPANAGNTTDFSVGVSPRQDVFALRFSGWLHLPKDGSYRFFLSSDDGAKLLLNGKVVVDNDGIHPAGFRDGSEDLLAGAHELVVEYFEFYGQEELAVEIEGPDLPRQPLAGLVTLTQQSPSEPSTTIATVPAELIQKGRAAFQSLGCAACHQHGDGDARLAWTSSATKFQDGKMKSVGGCLAESPAAGLPQFALTKQQREDATAAIEDNRMMRKITAEESAKIHLQQTMLTFNCYACHARGTIGGVNESTNHLFVGSIPEMGDEGRIPPALDGAGDKLNENWLKTILNEGAKDRPYMATRMPKFGESNVGNLVGSMATLDIQAEVPPVTFTEPDHRVKADARLMVGDQALSCIKCHIFDKYAATGIQSLDMTTMTRRLRRDWFHRYLANPQQYRPGTRMPSAWPSGRSVVPDILHGDPTTQIEAIWLYLSDGKNAKVPSGLQREAIELKPIDRPIIYRNFLEGLSPRGIAVGFRQKVHFAWDAEHMTPRLIWHGAFIDASKHWVDRGPGNQTPLGDHIMTLPAGPPIAELPSLDQSWPSDVARDHGFRFQGYRLDADGVPTFRYQMSTVRVEDRIQPFEATPDNGLERKLMFQSSEPVKNLFVRLAAGNSVEESDNAVTIDGVRFEFDGVTPVIRSSNGRSELLMPVSWKGNEASLTVRMRW